MDISIMLIVKAIIMGIVEGITEFLPISSTGHLIVVGDLIRFPKAFGENFEVVIQLGAILAVVYYFRIRITDSIKNLKKGQWGFDLWLNILVAFLPSAIIGLAFHKYIKMLFSPEVVAWAMIAGAVLLYIVQRTFNNGKYLKLEDSSFGKSILIGFAQCLSMIPGMSRSASTIIGGMVAGFDVRTAAEFSFFLAIPTMFAASGYELVKGFSSFTSADVVAIVVGFIVSFIVALFVVKKFMNFLVNHSMDVFAYYRFAAGIILLVLIKYGVIGA